MSRYRNRRGARPLLIVLVSATALTLGAAVVVATGPAPAAAARGDGSAGGARVVAEHRVGERLVDLTVESPALGGETAMVRLLTPDGWEQRKPGDTWPMLYLLHAATDTYQAWTEPWAEGGLQTWPELRDTLVVMPEAGPVGFYTNWWNEGAGGPPQWETFHLDELRGLLEDGYGAGERRVAAGLSMGGFGAVSYAGRRPGMFQAAASYSGPVRTLDSAFEEVLPALGEAVGADLGLLWGDPVEQRDVWAAHDPYHLADRLKDIPVYLSSGDGHPGPLDPPGSEFDENEATVLELNQATAVRFEDAGVPVTTNFYASGNHHPAYGERELRASLPLLLGVL